MDDANQPTNKKYAYGVERNVNPETSWHEIANRLLVYVSLVSHKPFRSRFLNSDRKEI